MKKKLWISGIIVFVCVIAGVLIYWYHHPVSAGSLFANEYHYVSCWYENYPEYPLDCTATPLMDDTITGILDKYELKRTKMDRSEGSYFFIDLRVDGKLRPWPQLYIFSDGRVWADMDNGLDVSSFEVVGDEKDALFKELAAYFHINV